MRWRLRRRQVLTNPRIWGPLVIVALLFLGAIGLSLAVASVAPGVIVGGIAGAAVLMTRHLTPGPS